MGVLGAEMEVAPQTEVARVETLLRDVVPIGEGPVNRAAEIVAGGIWVLLPASLLVHVEQFTRVALMLTDLPLCLEKVVRETYVEATTGTIFQGEAQILFHFEPFLAIGASF